MGELVLNNTACETDRTLEIRGREEKKRLQQQQNGYRDTDKKKDAFVLLNFGSLATGSVLRGKEHAAFIVLMIVLLTTPATATPNKSAIPPITSSAMRVEPLDEVPRAGSEMLMATINMMSSYILEVFADSLALSMGVTSVLDVMMRNSPGVQPKFAWM
jgi:hypothetical protein